jgi:AcrR family transcriptional regulator
MDEAVPVELRRLWGLTTPSRLGRPAGLDVEQVVAAAIDLADRDGLPGVTLPKVAAALGCTPMALYRHVGSKDELVQLMRDRALGDPPAIDPALGWRDGLREWSRAERRVNHRRPWLASAPIAGPPAGPHMVAWLETGLSILRDTGLSWADKIGVLTLLTGWVRYSTLLAEETAHARRPTGHDQPTAERAYAQALTRLITPTHYPELSLLLASPLFHSPPAAPASPEDDPDFTRGLDHILGGITTTITATHDLSSNR